MVKNLENTKEVRNEKNDRNERKKVIKDERWSAKYFTEN
jgi:hypothetical protein